MRKVSCLVAEASRRPNGTDGTIIARVRGGENRFLTVAAQWGAGLAWARGLLHRLEGEAGDHQAAAGTGSANIHKFT